MIIEAKTRNQQSDQAGARDSRCRYTVTAILPDGNRVYMVNQEAHFEQ